MIVGEDAFREVCRISREGFAVAIASRPHNTGLETERSLGSYWDESRRWTIDPLFTLAMAIHESQLLTRGTAVTTKSWGNTRNPSFGAAPVGETPGRTGVFPVFATFLDGCTSTVARLASTVWPHPSPYGLRPSIESVFNDPSGANWAPAGDGGNDPHGYLASMLRLMNQYADQADEPITATPSPPSIPQEAGMVTHHGLTGLRDRRGELPRNPGGGPNQQRTVSSKRGVVIHYQGPEVPEDANDWALLQADARYHISKDWSHTDAGIQHGDGLMYHVSIARDGTANLCRDFQDVLWHCGTQKNASALAWHVMLGGRQHATPAQLATLERLADEALAAGLTTRRQLTGHLEESATSCPGTLMGDFILPWRAGESIGAPPMADGHFFSATGYYVGGAFFQFWSEYGALPIFGLPLSNEQPGPCEDGATRTIQWFERARFEYHPEEAAGYTVLVTRLGAAAMASLDLS